MMMIITSMTKQEKIRQEDTRSIRNRALFLYEQKAQGKQNTPKNFILSDNMKKPINWAFKAFFHVFRKTGLSNYLFQTAFHLGVELTEWAHFLSVPVHTSVPFL
jgi:hypothetical protein